ncbi:hypothetical protein ABW20_dc0108849 [Dactylellina cionopaga]|nr:hypothetical protein ABW20_dc0108849 [Dactylellina cionopaga]
MEGVITCVIAIIGYIFMVPFPDDKNVHKVWNFLTKDEINFIRRKLDKDRGDVETEPFNIKKFLSAAKDPKVFFLGSILGFTAVVTYSLSFFLPLILHQRMGFSAAASQLLVAPPSLIHALWMVACCWFSDKYKLRGPVIIFNCVFSIVGILMVGWAPNTAAQYAGVFFVNSAAGTNIPLAFTYQANNIRGQWKRAFTSVVMVSSAALGGITGSLVFR